MKLLLVINPNLRAASPTTTMYLFVLARALNYRANIIWNAKINLEARPHSLDHENAQGEEMPLSMLSLTPQHCVAYLATVAAYLVANSP